MGFFSDPGGRDLDGVALAPDRAPISERVAPEPVLLPGGLEEGPPVVKEALP